MDNTSNKIRKITVGPDMSNQMVYSIDSKRPFFLEDGSKVLREIKTILEKEDGFFIYIASENNEIQLWKKLPKNNLTTVEYVID
jgi:hypothetical protein